MTDRSDERDVEKWNKQLIIAVRNGEKEKAEDLAAKIAQVAYYDRL